MSGLICSWATADCNFDYGEKSSDLSRVINASVFWPRDQLTHAIKKWWRNDEEMMMEWLSNEKRETQTKSMYHNWWRHGVSGLSGYMRYAYRLFPTNRLFQQKILIFFLYTFLSSFFFIYLFFKIRKFASVSSGIFISFFILNCLH